MASPTAIDVAARTMMADKPKKKRWIQSATSNSHGQFRKKAEAAGKSTAEFAKEHENSPGLIGKQARLAETLMGMRHKQASKIYTHPRSPRG